MPIVGRGSGFEEVPHYVYVPFRATLYYRTLEMQACYINFVELLQLLSRSCVGGGGGGRCIKRVLHDAVQVLCS